MASLLNVRTSVNLIFLSYMNKVELWLFNNLYAVWRVWNFITYLPYWVRYDVPGYFMAIKYFYQRGKTWYSDDMYWHLDDCIDSLYKRGLKDLVEKGIGYPTKYNNRAEFENELNKIRLVLEEEEPMLTDYKFQYDRYRSDCDLYYRKKTQAYKKLADLHFNLWD